MLKTEQQRHQRLTSTKKPQPWTGIEEVGKEEEKREKKKKEEKRGRGIEGDGECECEGEWGRGEEAVEIGFVWNAKYEER